MLIIQIMAGQCKVRKPKNFFDGYGASWINVRKKRD